MAVGTNEAGYAGPKYGPFRCGNCAHFNGYSHCNEPTVVADPQVKKTKVGGPGGGSETVAVVKAKGCCNMFDPKGK